MDDSQQEPTMEEILASIRRIISEDEEQPAEAPAEEPAAAAAPEPEPEPEPEAEPVAEIVAEPEPEPEPEPDDDVLELTQKVEEADDIVFDEPEEIAEPEPAAPIAAPIIEAPQEGFLEDETVAAAASSFDALAGSLPIYDGDAKTLEAIVQDMLRPMLKGWLDTNLPGIVEAKVQEEIERVARRGRGR
ncbi:MAG: DUF2497 domain-containing protein [Pseudomonadota bacterium]